MLNTLDRLMLEKVADLHEIPQGAYNIRKNGQGIQRNTTANIDIITKKDKPGIDIIVKPQTKGESVHIPVIITEENVNDLVYNTFEIGEYSDVLVVAGCGIHNSGNRKSQHDGIHNFFVRKGARMKYVEKHYGQGEGQGQKILNPKTIIEAEEGAVVELELIQIKGIDSTKRDTEILLRDKAKLVVTERLLTYRDQEAESSIVVELVGQILQPRLFPAQLPRIIPGRFSILIWSPGISPGAISSVMQLSCIMPRSFPPPGSPLFIMKDSLCTRRQLAG